MKQNETLGQTICTQEKCLKAEVIYEREGKQVCFWEQRPWKRNWKEQWGDFDITPNKLQ